MKWPFKRRTEHRASFTDAVATAIANEAAGAKSASPLQTAALEACAGLIGRAFASATVVSSSMVQGALDPATLCLIGRSLIRRGEIVLAIDTGNGGLSLIPASEVEIKGDHTPSSWRYKLTLPGPSRSVTRRVQADEVVHLRYSVEPGKPWLGVGPLQVAALAGRLSAETVKALADEAAGPVANLLGVPVDGGDETLVEMRKDIKKANGSVLLVELGDWGNVGAAKADGGFRVQRLGAGPPAPLVDQAEASANAIYAAVGVNPSVFTASQGTAAREAMRGVLFGLLAPIGRIVAAELAAKLETPVSFNWDELRASDIASRARAFNSLMQGGMDKADALAATGLS